MTSVSNDHKNLLSPRGRETRSTMRLLKVGDDIYTTSPTKHVVYGQIQKITDMAEDFLCIKMNVSSKIRHYQLTKAQTLLEMGFACINFRDTPALRKQKPITDH